MFNDSFYPTPRDLAEKMLTDIDWTFTREVLEPSAGKGDLAEVIQEIQKRHFNRWSSVDVHIDTIEQDPNLISILKGKEFPVIANDFLNFHTYKKYDAIIMNPPFANGDLHLLKAISLMERWGGYVVCLLNAETIRNPYCNSRKALAVKLKQLDADITFHEKAFADAERKTNIDVAMVKVKIPRQAYESTILNDLKASKEMDDMSSAEYTDIVVDDVVKAAVSKYEFEATAGIKFFQEYEAMRPIMSTNMDGSGNMITLKVDGKDNGGVNSYIKCVRKKYWNTLFCNESFMRLLTTNLREKYCGMVNELVDYDFSLYNIYSIQYEMSKEMCKGLEETILALFDEFSHTYSWIGETSNNIHYYNGWKTNSAFKINKKVIIPLSGWRDMSYSWGGFKPTHHDVESKLNDVVRVFDYLSGTDMPVGYLHQILQEAENTGTSKKIKCPYFTLTFYKKGTCHIEFQNERLLDKFNIFGSQKKGWLPPSYGYAHYDDMSHEEQSVIDEFQGKEAYNNVLQHKDKYLFDSSSLLKLGTSL